MVGGNLRESTKTERKPFMQAKRQKRQLVQSDSDDQIHF